MNFINELLENLEKEKFMDGIWGVGLADMQSLSKYNKRIKYLLCTIDFFSKYKKGTSIVNAFKKILTHSMELH